MIKFKLNEDINRPDEIPRKNDIEDNLFSWIPDQPSGFFARLVYNFALNSVLLPVAFLTLLFAVGGLVVLAFGKSSDWGILPKAIVAVALPTLIILMLVKTRFGNLVLGIWILLNYLAFAFAVLWILTPLIKAGFQPFFNLF